MSGIPGAGGLLPPGGFTELLNTPRLDRRAGPAELPPLEKFNSGYGPGRPAQTVLVRQTGRARVLPAQTHDASDPLWKAAKEFESLMLSQMFEHMFSGIKSEGMFGGGNAERTYRTFLMQAYGENVAENGGIGIADAVYREFARAYGHTNEDV